MAFESQLIEGFIITIETGLKRISAGNL